MFNRKISSLLVALLFLSLSSCATEKNSGRRAVVATVHPIATRAGIDAIKRGGNAVDAAVAAALMLGVVDSSNSGIGGGCFVVIRKADGTITAIDGREMAPAKAHRDMYVRNGKYQPHLSKTGALAIGIPGSLAVYDHLMRDAGNLELRLLLNDAADVAEKGFAIDSKLADHIAITEEIADFPPTVALLYNNGKPLQEGELLKQTNLAKTYRSIASDGIGHFYGGPFAKSVESWMNANGGIVKASDFTRYRIKQRETVKSTYRGHTIIGFPPPSSGGVHVAQILNMIERFNLKQTHRLNPVQHHHIIAEAMKLAFADRAHWLGDPDFAKVPRGLIDSDYARSLSLRIDPARTIAVGQHGSPPRADEDIFGKHTTHIATADAEGNWVAITTTLNTRFGSKVAIPGTGVIMNNQMDDFAAQPGVPNAYGLIGAEANSIAPGKRPLSSMSPTILLRDGQPVMTVGAAGGPTIISQVVQIIVNHVDLGMTLPQAVAAARVHHQWRPDKLYVEPALGEKMIDRLKAMGHSKVDVRNLGRSQAILLRDDGTMIGVTDPRIDGLAVGID